MQKSGVATLEVAGKYVSVVEEEMISFDSGSCLGGFLVDSFVIEHIPII